MPVATTIRAKLLTSVLAVGGAAAVAGLGTFGQFTTTTNASQNVSTAKLSFGGPNATDSLSTAVTGMVPGDSAQRLYDVVSGSTDIGSFQLSVASGAVSPASPTLLTTDKTGPDALTVQVDACSVAWTGSPGSYTCGGTESSVLPATSIPNLSTPTTLSGLNPASGADNFLLVTLALPTGADDNDQGLSDKVVYTFIAVQRTPVATK